MIQISEANFVVVDVETTGNYAQRDRITDIACITVKDFEIIDSYSSLINPHQHIPLYIQRLTGINNSMVKNAPDASEIFPEIKNLLNKENSFFVAHAVKFDSSFVFETFKREFIYFDEIPTICTLKIAQKILPKSIKKSVGSIADFFQIPIINRHRAYDDAFATAIFFIEMLNILRDQYEISTVEEIINFQEKKQRRIGKIKPDIKNKLLKYKKILPEMSGILLFIAANGKILYIARASNISQYLNSFIDQIEESSSKILDIFRRFHRIDWLTTNSELETLIVENRKIKFYEPKYNNYNSNQNNINSKPNSVNLFSDETLIKSMDSVQKTHKINTVLNLSMIVLLPNLEREKTIDIYFINCGKYAKMLTVGAKANLNEIFDEIHNIFYTKQQEWEAEIDFDEIKIINFWLRKYESLSQIQRFERQDELIFCEEIEVAIRNFYSDDRIEILRKMN